MKLLICGLPERRYGIMVSTLAFGSSGSGYRALARDCWLRWPRGLRGPGLIIDRGHCVVFLGKTRYSHRASLHPGVQMSTGKFNAGDDPAID